jgi:hypothetical protein
MPISKRIAAWFLVVSSLCVGGAVSAQSVDYEFGYAARETRPTTDNDLIYLNTGLTWQDEQGGARVEIFTGVRNEDFNGQFPAQLGLDYLRFQNRNGFQTGFGARANWSEDIATTAELFAGLQTFSAKTSMRGLIGAQQTFGTVPGRSESGVFGVAEFSWYVLDEWALRTGVQSDTDGTLVAIGSEWGLGKQGFSLLAEFAMAPDTYRGLSSHDNLTVAVRYTPGRGSLMDRDRRNADRLSHRYLAVQ